jgi:DNA-binding MarR family transcriptional regulator
VADAANLNPISLDGQLDSAAFEELARARVRSLDPQADADSMSLVLDLVRVTNEIVGDLEMTVHRPKGWSWAGFRIMFAVMIAGPLEPRQVARLAGVTASSISATLNTLERDGLVERTRASEDRRIVTILLTDAGRQAVLQGFRHHHEVERAWAGTLSPQKRRTLARLLRELLDKRPVLDAED